MGPLRLEKIAVDAEAPLSFDETSTVYREWADEQECRCYGQVNKVTGKPEGIVRKVTKAGYIYEGQYKDGQLNGQGRLICSDGKCYLGSWKADSFHGFGTIYNPDGSIRKQDD